MAERGYLTVLAESAFYRGPTDRCTIGDLVAVAQPGGFYDGWSTPNPRGPFKGAPGSTGW